MPGGVLGCRTPGSGPSGTEVTDEQGDFFSLNHQAGASLAALGRAAPPPLSSAFLSPLAKAPGLDGGGRGGGEGGRLQASELGELAFGQKLYLGPNASQFYHPLWKQRKSLSSHLD